jgi:thioredoxin-related protein
MSKILLTLLLSSLSLFALEFHSYDDALKLQKQNQKTIMIDVVRTDCHYCTDMEKNVLQDPEMIKYLEAKFIPVKINLDNEKLPLGIKAHFTPTFFFVDTEQKIIKTIPGSWNAQDFKDLTKNIK